MPLPQGGVATGGLPSRPPEDDEDRYECGRSEGRQTKERESGREDGFSFRDARASVDATTVGRQLADCQPRQFTEMRRFVCESIRSATTHSM